MPDQVERGDQPDFGLVAVADKSQEQDGTMEVTVGQVQLVAPDQPEFCHTWNQDTVQVDHPARQVKV